METKERENLTENHGQFPSVYIRGWKQVKVSVVTGSFHSGILRVHELRVALSLHWSWYGESQRMDVYCRLLFPQPTVAVATAEMGMINLLSEARVTSLMIPFPLSA